MKKKRWRRRVLLILAALGLVFLLDQLGVRRLSGSDFPPQDPLALVARARVERLASPEWGGRVPGTEGHREATSYLVHAFELAGLAPLPSLGGHEQPLRAPGVGSNVVGWIPPRDPAAAGPAIVLGAHYDHMGATPEGVLLGADDNASGVAVLLGSIAALKAAGPPSSPIVIVLFDTEESPYFGTARQGSRAFVKDLPVELARGGVGLAVVLDLIGGVVWRHSAQAIFACGAEKSPGLGDLVDAVHEDGLEVRRLGIHMVENIPGRPPSAFSDYDVFRERGVPFLFLSSGRTPRYHKATDLPATLHYDRMARTSRFIAALVPRVMAAPRLAFDPTREDLATDRRTALWFLEAAVLPWSSPPGTGPLTWGRLVGDRSRVSGMPETPSSADALDLERAGFRVQCLLYDYPACFTL